MYTCLLVLLSASIIYYLSASEIFYFLLDSIFLAIFRLSFASGSLVKLGPCSWCSTIFPVHYEGLSRSFSSKVNSWHMLSTLATSSSLQPIWKIPEGGDGQNEGGENKQGKELKERQQDWWGLLQHFSGLQYYIDRY